MEVFYTWSDQDSKVNRCIKIVNQYCKKKQQITDQNSLNRSQYGKYEAGSANITIGTLINILNCFGVSLSKFFNEEYENLKNLALQ